MGNNSFKYSRYNRSQQRGSALLAVLSILIMLGIALEISGPGGFSFTNALNLNARAKSGRDSLSMQIDRASSLPFIFRNSLAATENSDLRNCILGTGGSPCLSGGTEYPVALYLQAPNVTAGTAGKLLAGAGPATNNGARPALYDIKGNPCGTNDTVASTACPFEVYSTFTAQCLGAAPSCTTAESIQVHYIIQTPSGVTSMIQLGGRTTLAKVDKFANSILTQSILPPNFNYNPNAIRTTSLITMNGPGTPGGTVQGGTYDQVLNVISEVLSTHPNPTTTAQEAANRIYNEAMINDLAVVRALAEYWAANPAAASEVAWRTAGQMGDGLTTTDTIAFVNSIRDATSWIQDPIMQVALAAAGVHDSVFAHTAVNNLVSAGVVNNDVMQVVAQAGITNLAITQGLNSAITSTQLNDTAIMNAVAFAAEENQISSAATLTLYADLFMRTGVDQVELAIDIVRAGVTDQATIVTMAQQYAATHPSSVTAQTMQSGTTPSNPSGGANSPPVAMAPSCTSAQNCGTAIGM